MSTEPPIPETRYVETDGVSIAYQVYGSGSHDLVMVPGIVSHIELNWQHASYTQMMRELARTFRLILFDKRGQGMSDRFDGVPTLEERMDDVRAVMQAAGSRRASLLAQSEGGAMAALFTATYPDAVDKLILWGTMARYTGGEGYPHMPTLAQHLRFMERTWGKPEAAKRWAPSLAGNEAFDNYVATYMRQSASPGSAKRMVTANEQIDVRAVLPQIRRPTLVLHRRHDQLVPVANGRYLADHIPDATYLEVPGFDHFLPAGDIRPLIDAICRFASDGVAQPSSELPQERWLATVLFVDIVGSTDLAVRLGDRPWRDLQQRFFAAARERLQAHRGREIDTAGDGLFATFDGPARAVRCARAIDQAARELGLTVRSGLHTGEVEASGSKVAGIAVHIGARVMAQAGAGEVLVSATVKDLIAGSGLRFEPHGLHELKGVPGEWTLHRAVAEDG